MVNMVNPSKGSLSDVLQVSSLTISPVKVVLSSLFIICPKKEFMLAAEQVDGKQTPILNLGIPVIRDTLAMQYFPCIL